MMTQLLVVIFMLLAQLLSSRNQARSGPGRVSIDVPTAAIMLTSVTLTPSEQIVSVGGSAFFQAIGTFSDGTMADVTHTVIWTASSDATIVMPGHVSVPTVATVTVSASSGRLIANASVVVR